jgi:hypothetical protein
MAKRGKARLSNSDLALGLETLAKQAGDLAGAVKSNGDFPPRKLDHQLTLRL